MNESYDADNLMDEVTERSIEDDEKMEEHSFVQMTNGTIKVIDPVDETMNLI